MIKFKDLPDRELLRPDEVAAYLSVSVKTVYNWSFMGVLSTTFVNGTILRIIRDSVVALVERGTDPDVSKRTRGGGGDPAPTRSTNGKRKVIDPGIKR